MVEDSTAVFLVGVTLQEYEKVPVIAAHFILHVLHISPKGLRLPIYPSNYESCLSD